MQWRQERVDETVLIGPAEVQERGQLCRGPGRARSTAKAGKCIRYAVRIRRSSESQIPVVDISGRTGPPDARAFAVDAFGTACRDVGFVAISGHGVERERVATMQKLAIDFFTQPLDLKMRCCDRHGPNRFKGYVPLERMATGRGSLIEIFQAKPFETAEDALAAGVPADRVDEYSGNTWPDFIHDFHARWTEYYKTMTQLAAELFEMTARFFGAPPDYFEPLIDHHVSDLALNFYPPQHETPDTTHLRAQPHTDFGTLTLLAQDSAGGLQIEDDNGEWVDVPVVNDTFVVNLGELMTPWTSGQWRATRHRVISPPATSEQEHRLSIACFHKPNYRAVVTAIPGSERHGVEYPPIIAGEWFDQRRRTEAKASAMETTS